MLRYVFGAMYPSSQHARLDLEGELDHPNVADWSCVFLSVFDYVEDGILYCVRVEMCRNFLWVRLDPS
jgi:hypothetical protein